MKKSNPIALLPIGVFLVIYLGLGLLFKYRYQHLASFVFQQDTGAPLTVLLAIDHRQLSPRFGAPFILFIQERPARMLPLDGW